MPVTEILCALLDRRIAMARADAEMRAIRNLGHPAPHYPVHEKSPLDGGGFGRPIEDSHRPGHPMKGKMTYEGYAREAVMVPYQEAVTRIVGVFDAKIAEEVDERADLIHRVALLEARVRTLEREMLVAAPGVRAAIVAEDEKSWATDLAAEKAEAIELGNAEEAMRVAIQRQREGREARAAARTTREFMALVNSSPGLAHPSTPRSPSGTSCASWAVP